jgi:hypothetical protein
MSREVWVVFDCDDLVAVAATEARARQAAEEHAADHIDKGYFSKDAEKRFQWKDGQMSIWDRTSPRHRSPVGWCPTGFTINAATVLDDDGEAQQ